MNRTSEANPQRRIRGHAHRVCLHSYMVCPSHRAPKLAPHASVIDAPIASPMTKLAPHASVIDAPIASQMTTLTPHVSAIDAPIASQMSVRQLRRSRLVGYDQRWPLQGAYAHVTNRVLGNSLRLCLYELGGTRGTPLTYQVMVSTGTQ